MIAEPPVIPHGLRMTEEELRRGAPRTSGPNSPTVRWSWWAPSFVHDQLFLFLNPLLGLYLEVRPPWAYRGSRVPARLRPGLL